MIETLAEREGIAKLTKDLRAVATSMCANEVRYVVDTYYQLQHMRIATAGQVRSMTAVAPKTDAATYDELEEPTDDDLVPRGEPSDLIRWLCSNLSTFEREIPKAMKDWALKQRPGRWALSIHGIGPILAAGLLAHIKIELAPTVGHIWRFAGLDPTLVWKPKTKRPFNAKLKVLCWKIGQSFMKLRGSENDIYGKVYEARKAYEIMRNERGDHKGYKLRMRDGGKEVEKLPPFIIDARARRYAVKLFLSHLHHVMYESHYGTTPPKPMILEHPALDPSGAPHTHFLAPPMWPCE